MMGRAVLVKAFSIACEYLADTDLLLIAKENGKKGEMRRATKEEWAREIFNDIKEELKQRKGS